MLQRYKNKFYKTKKEITNFAISFISFFYAFMKFS